MFSYSDCFKFQEQLTKYLGNEYKVIVCPATMVLSNDYGNIKVIPELTKEEFYKLIGKENTND